MFSTGPVNLSSFLLNTDQIMVSLDILSARPVGQNKTVFAEDEKTITARIYEFGISAMACQLMGNVCWGLDLGRVPMGNHDNLQSKCF